MTTPWDPTRPDPDDAALAAVVAAAYANAPVPPEAAAAACAAEVLARAERARLPRVGGWGRHRWWGGAAAAAALLLVVSMREELRLRAPASVASRPAATAAPEPQLTRFAVTLPAGARSVTLVGDFNGWDPGATPMHAEGGTWQAAVALPPGRHVYAFVVDGEEWRVDPLAPQVPDAGLGPANAVIVDGPQ